MIITKIFPWSALSKYSFWLDLPFAQFLWLAALLSMKLRKKIDNKNIDINLPIPLFLLLFALFLLQQQLFFSLVILTAILYRGDNLRPQTYKNFAALLIFSSLSVKSTDLLSTVVYVQMCAFISKSMQMNLFASRRRGFYRLWSLKLPFLTSLAMSACVFYFYSKGCVRFDAFAPNRLPRSAGALVFTAVFLGSLLINLGDVNIAMARNKLRSNCPSASALLLTTVPSYVAVSAAIKFIFVNCATFIPVILPYINGVSFLVIAIAAGLLLRQIFLSAMLNTFGLLSVAFSLLTVNILSHNVNLKTFTKILGIIGFYFGAQFIAMFIFVVSIQPVISEFRNIKSFDYLKGLWGRDKKTSLSLIIAAFSLSGVAPPTMGFFAYFRILQLFVKTNTSEALLFSLMVFLLVANLRFCSKVITYIVFYKSGEGYHFAPQSQLQTYAFAMSVVLLFGFLIKSFMF